MHTRLGSTFSLRFTRDPFDRILVTQALMEEITLLTADPVVARYPGPIRAF